MGEYPKMTQRFQVWRMIFINVAAVAVIGFLLPSRSIQQAQQVDPSELITQMHSYHFLVRLDPFGAMIYRFIVAIFQGATAGKNSGQIPSKFHLLMGDPSFVQ